MSLGPDQGVCNRSTRGTPRGERESPTEEQVQELSEPREVHPPTVATTDRRTWWTGSEHLAGPWRRQPEMTVCRFGGDPPSRSALDEPQLQQVRIVDVFDRLGLLPHRGGQRGKPD